MGLACASSAPRRAVLAATLPAYVEERLGLEAIVARGHDEITVRRVLRMVVGSEYKRRQAAPVLKVSEKAFGEGRRFPIAHGYRYGPRPGRRPSPPLTPPLLGDAPRGGAW